MSFVRLVRTNLERRRSINSTNPLLRLYRFKTISILYFTRRISNNRVFCSGVQDIHYNQGLLLEQLETCAEMLEKAERYELLGHLYRLIIPIYENKRDYEALSICYTHLSQACTKIVQVTKSGKRLLGRFYRVAFFGSVSTIFLFFFLFLPFGNDISRL